MTAMLFFNSDMPTVAMANHVSGTKKNKPKLTRSKWNHHEEVEKKSCTQYTAQRTQPI
jgi:hypothetical protein